MVHGARVVIGQESSLVSHDSNFAFQHIWEKLELRSSKLKVKTKSIIYIKIQVKTRENSGVKSQETQLSRQVTTYK